MEDTIMIKKVFATIQTGILDKNQIKKTNKQKENIAIAISINKLCPNKKNDNDFKKNIAVDYEETKDEYVVNLKRTQVFNFHEEIKKVTNNLNDQEKTITNQNVEIKSLKENEEKQNEKIDKQNEEIKELQGQVNNLNNFFGRITVRKLIYKARDIIAKDFVKPNDKISFNKYYHSLDAALVMKKIGLKKKSLFILGDTHDANSMAHDLVKDDMPDIYAFIMKKTDINERESYLDLYNLLERDFNKKELQQGLKNNT